MINGVSPSFGKAAMPMMLRSWIITDEVVEMAKLPNVHPGEVLLEEFLKPMGISQNRIAREIGVPPRRINEIVHGKRAITADTALRLSKYFNVSESFWMGLQADYDLEEARKELGRKLDRVRPHAA
jgi:addiction module HigA family antidote